MTEIKILDGAMGSELIRHGEILPPHIWSAKINLTNPNLIYKIHNNYIEQGADYITTNTFRSTPRAFKKMGQDDDDAYNNAKQSLQSAIQMAKKAANQCTKILGSIAPLEDCYSPTLFPGVKKAKKEFKDIGLMLNKSGIDIFLLETMNSIIETSTCLEAIKQFNIPIWVSFNLLNSTQIRSGESLEEAIAMTKNYAVSCLLLNCNPLNRTIKALTIIKENWKRKWGLYPNLGIGEPSTDGVISHYHSNAEFSKVVDISIRMGASIIGSCCGSNPKHIGLIKKHININLLNN